MLLPGFAALAAELCARRQFRAATGTFGGRQRGAALLAKARIARIGAAALGAGIAGIAAAWATALRVAWISAVTAMFGTAVMAAPVAAMVAAESAPHQIAQRPFKESHDLSFYPIGTALTISDT